MEEIEFEQNNLQYGTAKKKAELMSNTNISPVKMANAVKKFGKPMPSVLSEAESYASDLFDYLLDSDPTYYGQFDEDILMLDIAAYVMGEVWLLKHKSRAILDNRCAVALDMRKVLKDGLCAWSQTVGHMLKHSPEALQLMDKESVRVMLIEAAEEATAIAFERPLKTLNLLDPRS